MYKKQRPDEARCFLFVYFYILIGLAFPPLAGEVFIFLLLFSAGQNLKNK
jgi:hypothetical protein